MVPQLEADTSTPVRRLWAGKDVFVTGHTGFKGSWLALWLAKLGARVTGYALAPPTQPAFFEIARVGDVLHHSVQGDIRDQESLVDAMKAAAPEVVFHLAAQSLVRYSYVDPVETFDVNVVGTAKVLEAARACESVKVVVVVTTDKCYENREWVWPYREVDQLGGYDPYSSSKACAELVTSAYRRSFLASRDIRVATARAGNVIGGGDWAKDRLIPDFVKAMASNKRLTIRSPNATRPWQHVLEPLNGYLKLAEKLSGETGAAFSDAWNFGPREEDLRSVLWIARTLCTLRRDVDLEVDPAGADRHEAKSLMLSSAKAESLLGWRPKWPLRTAIEKTLEWSDAYMSSCDMRLFSQEQIEEHQRSGSDV